MSRKLVGFALALAVLGGSGAAWAQSSRLIPVERDLERYQRLEDRLEWSGTGSIGYDGYRYRNRSALPGSGVAAPHVPGFDGPPGGILRDSVGNSGPLPPGSPVNAGNE